MTNNTRRDGRDMPSATDTATASASREDAPHTPGPWMCSRFRLNFGGVVIIPSAHSERPFGGSVDRERQRATYAAPIAHVTDEKGGHFGREEGDANARLIASAPDLLAALKGMVAWFAGERNKAPVAAAQAAIKKAEGR